MKDEEYGHKGWYRHKYSSLLEAVNRGSITSKVAAELYGVHPRSFRKIVDRGDGPSAIKVQNGKVRLYAWDQVYWHAKKYRINPFFSKLRNKDLTDSERVFIQQALAREKMKWVALVRSYTLECESGAVESVYKRMHVDEKYKAKVEETILDQFPDDLEDEYRHFDSIRERIFFDTDSQADQEEGSNPVTDSDTQGIASSQPEPEELRSGHGQALAHDCGSDGIGVGVVAPFLLKLH